MGGGGGSQTDTAAQGSISIWDTLKAGWRREADRFKGGGIYDCLSQAVGDYGDDFV